MEFLKENAEYFEKKAFEAIKEKPKFVLFFSEQALQLYVKYILTKELGDYPKTHNLRILFNELAKINDKAKVFYEDNADVFDLLEEAYVTARYLNKEYSIKSAEKALNLLKLKKFKEEFKEWLV
ncbi:HEPN domain protein [Ferroglobus placidus DSM 10642]|uniref:HEPN domain protein n=1 Tax=Ferroglobus placidus (strain DSM 10642 / AEDII12DO) TaxID=589924 RepID=D3S1F6_FERPA|nr:HEPN domain-containing protein [Ferroglobus placidus]ADC66420.1 HEPN domain protein [Ferroglobus placidus DSM 10642]